MFNLFKFLGTCGVRKAPDLRLRVLGVWFSLWIIALLLLLELCMAAVGFLCVLNVIVVVVMNFKLKGL